MSTDIQDRCNTIEECYEFMLAYAAQGFPGHVGSTSSGEIREYLGRAVAAATGLAHSFAAAVKREGLDPAERYHAFFEVVVRDASDSIAAIQLVLAQPIIGSQLVDNLNASIHLRALLTDLFLVSEILKAQPAPARSAG